MLITGKEVIRHSWIYGKIPVMLMTGKVLYSEYRIYQIRLSNKRECLNRKLIEGQVDNSWTRRQSLINKEIYV